MIVANINNQEFILESQKDAEQLLNILSRAQPVESNYSPEDYRRYYYLDGTCEVGVSILTAEVVSIEEHAKRLQEHKDRTTKVAKGAAA